MTGPLLRRALLSMSFLVALLVAGSTVLVLVGVPLVVPIVASLLLVLGQWAVAPLLVQWLVPARIVRQHEGGYERRDEQDVVGELVARRCHDAGLRLPRLGIVDDGTPNAFTFGRHRGDARLYVTRGLLERLDRDELDAVISHEVGHIRQNDFLVMTFASVVPLVLYYAYLVLWSANDSRTKAPALGALAAYWASQLAVLSLGRSRELSADHWSCSVTGNGDALASALVKIGYGMGEVDAERAAHARVIANRDEDESKKGLRRTQRRERRIRAAGALGIADPAQGSSMLAAHEQGLEPREVVGAMRWDACNPWARIQQALSTHPLVVRRIAALESNGLPGAAQRWHAAQVAGSCAGPEVDRARRRFPAELLVRALPTVGILAIVLLIGVDRWSDLPLVVAVTGLALLVKAWCNHRPGPAEPVDRVSSLLERLDAGPVTGLPVSLRGRVVGRGVPGYVLSPDLVVQDESGFVPVLYRQPWPFARSIFGFFEAGDFLDEEVLVSGWYRREPAPVLELRRLDPPDGATVRGFWWVATYAVAVAMLLGGAVAYGLQVAF